MFGWRKSYARYKGFFLDIIDAYKQRQDLKMFIEVLLTLAAISLLLVFALRPTMLTIISLVKEIKGKQETIAKMDVKIENLRKAQSLVSSEHDSLVLLDDAIPIEPQPDSFIRQVQGFASTNSSQIKNISVDETTLKGTVKKVQAKKEEGSLPSEASGISFSAGFSGKYEDLASFLEKLESLRRPLKINSVSLNKTKDTEKTEDEINFNIAGEVPYLVRYPNPEKEEE